MKILHVSDLHGNEDMLNFLEEKQDDYDLILITGDILPYLHDFPVKIVSAALKRAFLMVGISKKKYLEKAQNYIDRLDQIKKPIFFIWGNQDILKEEIKVRKMVYVGNQKFEIKGKTFYGIEIDKKIREYKGADIILSHFPHHGKIPYFYDKNLKNFVSENKPKIVLHGHVHQKQDMFWRDNILVINSAQRGTLIDLNKKQVEYVYPENIRKKISIKHII